MLVKFANMYATTWKVALCYLTGRWEQHKEATKEAERAFLPLPVAPNMVLNAVSYVLFVLMLNWLVGFSQEYQRFIALYSLVPTLVLGLGYYYYVFGGQIWHIAGRDLAHWANNWVMGTGIAAVSFTQMALHYALLLGVEQLLPREWQGHMTFPRSTIEDSVQTVIVVLYCMGFALLVTSPFWIEGYELTLRMVGRSGHLGSWEAALEIVYTTSQCAIVLQFQTALALLQEGWGLPFHFIHFMVAMVESACLHQMVKFKFAWIHQLCHEVRPLYNLTHLEHHICKGTYCTSPACGLWEQWIEGGTLFFCNSLACIPYLFFQAVIAGPNVVVHSMWPHRNLLQWHSLHHVVHSDVYAVNVPSEHDLAFSKDVRKFREMLRPHAFFIRNPGLSDGLGFAISGLAALAMHYGLGIGVPQVWHEKVMHFATH